VRTSSLVACTRSFYGYDGHGNVRFLTSSADTVGNTYQFDAFGMPISSTGTMANSYLYSGERFATITQNVLDHIYRGNSAVRHYRGPSGNVATAGVGPLRVLTALELLILGTATMAKNAPLPDPLYVHCTKMLFALESRDTTDPPLP
jgi:hypothetical protein